MVIIGAKGLAKEVLEIFFQRALLNDIYFFDDVSADVPEKLFGKFRVLKSIEDVRRVFESENTSFTLGLGKPAVRFALSKKMKAIDGTLASAISPAAEIGHFGNSIGNGCTILSHAVVTNGVTIGEGCLLNPHVSISHDSLIGSFVELSPGARVTGHARIGNFSVLGTNSVILPHVKIGQNVVVGAGAVVTRDVPDNCVVAGVPARVIKELPPLVL